ncbi:unnamed protein product [Rotaria sordida]|uniref:Uncharacterized protein n=1 Tax=Rotaria sordida TaxID=392033 RepID=A0A820DDZ5_9BILA|nr:unnamed protein product [Rotaria sordida]
MHYNNTQKEFLFGNSATSHKVIIFASEQALQLLIKLSKQEDIHREIANIIALFLIASNEINNSMEKDDRCTL